MTLTNLFVLKDSEDVSISSETSFLSDASTVPLDESPFETPRKKCRTDDQSHKEMVKNVSCFSKCCLDVFIVEITMTKSISICGIVLYA